MLILCYHSSANRTIGRLAHTDAAIPYLRGSHVLGNSLTLVSAVGCGEHTNFEATLVRDSALAGVTLTPVRYVDYSTLL